MIPTLGIRRRGEPELIRPAEEAAWVPRSLLGQSIFRALPFLPADLRAEVLDRIRSAMVGESELRVTVLRRHGLFVAGLIPWAEVGIEEYGVVSRRLVTDTGVGFLVDACENLVESENLKYHGLGTGTGAEASGDSALGTELTTEYTGNVRATGTTAETSANIYQSVATNTLDSGTPAVTEHGLFSASAAGVLLDRSKFSAINLVGANGDALTSDYRLTLTSGG